MAEVDVSVFLKPDKVLASLEAKLRKATGNEAAAIQKQIDARQAELTAQYGSVGFGSGGYVIPNYAYSEASGAEYGDRLTAQTGVQNALAGKMQLMPTATYYVDPVTGQTTNLNPIYQAQYYGPQGQTGFVKDPVTGELVDQYEYAQKQTLAQLAGTADPKSLLRTFYDESGKPLTPEQVAKTAQGVGQARAGYDIGFGPGMIAPGVDARTLSDDQLRGGIVNNLVASGEMRIPGYDPVTGTVTPTTGTTTATSSTGTTGSTSNLAFGPGSAGYGDRKSAYDILFQEFNRYGLGAMVEPLKSLITEGVSPSEFGIRLTQTDAYKKRFAANQDRINKGLRALTPAEYIGLEDQYQSLMRNYGLPASYYTKDSLGTQEGFNKLIGADVSAAELEDRIATAQKRVLNTNPEVLQALKQFYPDLNNADILAYTLDPSRALSEIQRKVTAAEIGGAALSQGLEAQGGTAEALAGIGLTKSQAQQGYQTIAEFLPTAQKLSDIYQNQGLGGYDQATAEREVFGTSGAASAGQKRKKLAQLEQATFSGQSGASQGAFDRGRQGAF